MRYASFSPIIAGKRIVVIADNSIVLLLWNKFFSQSGLAVVGEAVSLEDGSTFIRREQPDLVLIDLDLRDIDEDGGGAVRQVRAESEALVIALSTDTKVEYQRRVLEAGACCFLSKPVMPAELIAALENCLAAGE